VISVIIPTYNELHLGVLPRALETLRSVNDVEIICVDRQSTDGTVEFLRQQPQVCLLRSTSNSRGQRLNEGIAHAKGEVVVLHHPRSVLDVAGLEFLRARPELPWGGFVHCFDHRHPLLRFTSWYSNHVRLKRKGIVYLDHCIFFRKQLVDPHEMIPDVDIFEDTALSLKLLESLGMPFLVPHHSTTSAVRFVKNGVVRQAIMNQVLKLGYSRGWDHQKMNRFYERRVPLNSKY